ncbi:P-loop containing nucleoside triphosphate hydrolase protein [Syncephalis fuscata]|nr:P-loop containing nucleoside triphosphate hydrolase protein [Syncephalis fuscata]
MTKKKKVKPSAQRGYATTSLPKKQPVSNTAEPVITATASDTKINTEIHLENVNQLANKENENPSVDSQSSSKKAITAEQVAQERDLSEKSAATWIHVHSNAAKMEQVDQLPRLQLSQDLEKKTARLWMEIGIDYYHDDDNDQHGPSSLVRRLMMTYSVLANIGFEADLIRQAMQATGGIKVTDALDWLCIHAPLETVPPRFRDKFYHLDDDHVTFVKKPPEEEMEKSPEVLTLPDIPVKTTNKRRNSKDKLDIPARTFSPLKDNQKAWILEQYTHQKVEKEEKDVNKQLAALHISIKQKKQLHKQAKESGTAYSILDDMKKGLRKLEREHELLQGDPEANKDIIQQLLWNDNIKSRGSKKSKRSNRELLDQTEGEDDDLLGSLWDLSEETTQPPDVKSTSTSTPPLQIIEEILCPQGWTGKLPKNILIDYCRQRDRQSRVTFIPSSKLKHSKTHCIDVKIGWSNGSIQLFETSVCCRRKADAENYISTVVLYELAQKPVYRLLPPPYRDIWCSWDKEKMDAKLNEQHVKDESMAAMLSEIVTLSKEREQSLRDELNTATSDLSGPSYGRRKYEAIPAEAYVPRGKISEMRLLFERHRTSPAYSKLLLERQQLPVYEFREQLLSTIQANRVVLLVGDTGCGKTTQVPQYIVEHLLGNESTKACQVMCTQPRRISAMSISKRVSIEMGESIKEFGTFNSLVGYQVRLDNRTSTTSALIYCTTGIMLRRLEDLRIIIMSATVDTDKFRRYFDDCPVIQVPGRTFPVTVNYLEDIIEATVIIKLNNNNNNDDDDEIESVNIRGKGGKVYQMAIDIDMEEDWSMTSYPAYPLEQLSGHYSDITRRTLGCMDEERINYDLIIRLLEYLCFEQDTSNNDNATSEEAITSENIENIETIDANTLKSITKASVELSSVDEAILIFLPGLPEIRILHERILDNEQLRDSSHFLIIPVHSLLAGEHQERAFQRPPKGMRKIILSTNLAETGITIPDVTIVIDTGKVKEMRYDEKRRVSALEEGFVARANARQRRGRAGRVQPGVCYHLFTQHRHNNMMFSYQTPEMLRLPLQELCLRIKAYGYGSVEPFLLNALDKPRPEAINTAMQQLVEVGAIASEETAEMHQPLTPLGEHLARLPLDVHLAKIIFIRPYQQSAAADQAKQAFATDNSDMLTIYKAYCQWREVCRTRRMSPNDFCKQNYLDAQVLQVIEDTKRQILGLLVSTRLVTVDAATQSSLSRGGYQTQMALCPVPVEANQNAQHINVLRAIIVAGLYPRVARRDHELHRWLIRGGATVVVHPSSINQEKGLDRSTGSWLAYNVAQQSGSNAYVWDTTVVNAVAVVLFGREMEVEHLIRRVTLEDWIKFKCVGVTAAVLRRLRRELNAVLRHAIYRPGELLPERLTRWLDLAIEVVCA